MPAANQKNITEWLGRYFQDAWPLPRAAAVLAERTKSARSHRQIDDVLKLADEMMNAHGIEAVRGKHVDSYYMNIVGLYVNMGCPYTGTLLYDTVTNKFLVTTLGDWQEKNEKKYRIR